MAFRERIEAILKVRDLARFKGGLKSAARSVSDFEHEAEQSAATLEVLREVEKRLGHQTEVLAAQTELLAAAQDHQAEEAKKAARATDGFTRTVYRTRGGLRDSITRLSFWKDRLSLTRSEIMTTALTLGAYLAPALIAVGNSAVAAAMGGGAVAGAGLASLITGFGLLAVVGGQMVNQVKKIQKAQDAYNLAVVQYGKGSKEAARQAAHMYAVIQTQGGKPILDATNALRAFGKAWTGATGGARVNEAKILTAVLTRLTQIIPMIGQEINMMSLSLRKALTGALKDLTGGEGQTTFKVLSNLFQDAIGPGVRGVTNVIIVLSRYIRAAAPWALKLARGFERITFGWRRSTHDGLAVQHTIDTLVHHTQAWINLGKELFRTLRIIFSDSKTQGGLLVVEMTGLVKQFNDWLQAVSDAGKIGGLFDQYIRSLHDLVWAIQHPVDAIRKWLPIIMDTIATAIGHNGPKAAALFLDAFVHAGAWAQFLTIAFLASKFGVFSILGRTAGKLFVQPFIEAFMAKFVVTLGVEAAAGGVLGSAAATAGAVTGALFWAAFVVGIGVLLGIALTKAYEKWAGTRTGRAFLKALGLSGPGDAPGAKAITKAARQGTGQDPSPPITHYTGPVQARGPNPSPSGAGRISPRGGVQQVRHKAEGGLIPSGTMAMVGERGPELAFAGPGGAHISPLVGGGVVSGSGVQPMGIPPISVSDFVPPISVSVQIDRREIANAVASYQDFRRARRGEG